MLYLPSCSYSKAPAGVSAPTKSLLTKKTLREKEKEVAIFLDSLTDKTGAVPNISSRSGGTELQRNTPRQMKNICHLKTFFFSITCP